MNMAKWILLLAVLIVAAVLSWHYVFRQRAGIEEQSADFKLTAKELAAAFANNEAQASAKFVGKVLEIEGIVAEHADINGLLLYGDDGHVYCTLATNQILPGIGQSVRLKGLCTGYLLDVVMIDCIIL